MPPKIKKVDGYQVSTPGGIKAKNTTLAKAKRQANLLRAVEHNPEWEPTGKPARDVRVNQTPTGTLKKLRMRKKKA
jgi:hypothetical protein